mmetsp:Transcript_47459/g.112854  ORF Transcript_47459/g.112854 Transcript_47459/m.112854 type:complete len:86 (-) Transcript_47459:101-358(-)
MLPSRTRSQSCTNGPGVLTTHCSVAFMKQELPRFGIPTTRLTGFDETAPFDGNDWDPKGLSSLEDGESFQLEEKSENITHCNKRR